MYKKVFFKAARLAHFKKNEKIEDSIEEYQEQDFVMEDKQVTSIETIKRKSCTSYKNCTRKSVLTKR